MVEALPDFPLSESEPAGRAFAGLGIRTYRDAARAVWRLPYGRTSDRADYLSVLAERRGTCSTKHALLAALARENAAPVRLALGIYLMSEANTPGVGAALSRHRLTAVPEAHCYLRFAGRYVDITRAGVASVKFDFLTEEFIDPGQIGAYKTECHRAFLTRWAQRRNLAAEDVWRAREVCIADLGFGPASRR